MRDEPTIPVDALDKTAMRRLEQYRDRWTSFGLDAGLIGISDKPSVDELRELEIFQDYDDKFLERISPDVSVAVWRQEAVLFEAGSYIDLAFFIVEGAVEVFAEGGAEVAARPIFDLSRTIAEPPPPAVPADGVEASSRTILMRRGSATASHITLLASMDFDLPRGTGARLGPGELLGEIGAMSGWPQSVTARVAEESRIVQIRVPALRLMKRKSKALKERLDKLYKERSLADQLKNTPIFRGCSEFFIAALKEIVELVSCESNEAIVREGEPADAVYVVRSGFVKLLQSFGEGDMAVTYLSKGMTLGEVELLVDGIATWQVTAVSVEHAELIKVPREVFEHLVRGQPEVERQLWRSAADRIKEAGFSRRDIRHSEFTQVALETGLVQGNSILAIDLNVCTRCDDCVRACADTHGGRPRFVREGNKYRNLLIAKSCYHCRDPVCLVGCPTGAIHRAGTSDVVEVDEEICIGCSTCARNCPYDAIVMHDTGELWPDDMLPSGLRGKERQLASKCDQCHDTGHEPACVTNCPQGCAYRVGTLEEFQGLLARGS